NFDSDYLSCDCGLRWMPSFFRSSSVRVGDETLCAFPRTLRGKPLQGLRESQLSCGEGLAALRCRNEADYCFSSENDNGPLEMHTLSLLPSQRQVVFRGDRLPFHCTAALVDKITSLHWRHNGQVVTSDPKRGVQLEDNVVHDCTFITSELILFNVHVEASGEWECVVTTGRGNASRNVEIVVLENSASFCPEDKVVNNRGEFRWPRTLAGITSHQYCLQLRYPSLSVEGVLEQKKASRYCDRSGKWHEGDYSNCQSGDARNSVALASVTLPATLFPPDAAADCKLQFVAFRSGSFFPVLPNSSNTVEQSRRRSEVPTFPNSSSVSVRVLHPVVYACTAVLLLCLFTIIITHILHHSYPLVCQAVSFTLGCKFELVFYSSHLITLLLYMTGGYCSSLLLTVNTAVDRGQHQGHLQRGCVENTPTDGRRVFPSTYSATYAQVSDCWLIWRSSLGSFFVPAGLVVLVTWIYFLCVVLRLRHRVSKECTGTTLSSSGTEGHPALAGSTSLLSTDSAGRPITPAVPPEDQYSLKTQFYVLVATHFLFAALWCCGAMAVWLTGHTSLLFSCLYGIVATVLGVFLVVHHCFRRRDVQASWLGCCPGYRPSHPMSTYTNTCTTGSGVQTSEQGSQLFINCHQPADSNNSSSARSSSTPSGISSIGPGPCKLTNLLQVAQDNPSNTSRVPTSNNTSTSTDNITKPTNNILPSINSSAPVHPQRRKVTSRTKQGSSQQYHRGEGRSHYRLKALRTAGGGGSLGALGPTGSEHLNSSHAVYKQATSENGSIHHSLSENQASMLTNGKRMGESAATSPSEWSDGGSSGSRKPFPLPPSAASRVAMHSTQRRCSSRDNLKVAASAERETKRSSYPLNCVATTVSGGAALNGTMKTSVLALDQDMSGTDQSQSSVGMKTGLWKSETTV
ncbi:hypothetical protein XENOCAPTIV_007928, partial [Xenoophorus captivus]